MTNDVTTALTALTALLLTSLREPATEVVGRSKSGCCIVARSKSGCC